MTCRDYPFNPLYPGNIKRVLLQAVKTLIKCSIMLHFIRVYTVCKGKKISSDKRIQIYNLTPLDMYSGLSQNYCIKPVGRIHFVYTEGY